MAFTIDPFFVIPAPPKLVATQIFHMSNPMLAKNDQSKRGGGGTALYNTSTNPAKATAISPFTAGTSVTPLPESALELALALDGERNCAGAISEAGLNRSSGGSGSSVGQWSLRSGGSCTESRSACGRVGRGGDTVLVMLLLDCGGAGIELAVGIAGEEICILVAEAIVVGAHAGIDLALDRGYAGVEYAGGPVLHGLGMRRNGLTSEQDSSSCC